MAVKYTTDQIAPNARFDYWRDVICDAYLPIECDTPDHRQFDGEILLERLSQINLSLVSGSPQRIARHKSQITRDSDAYFMLSLQLSDNIQLTQSDREAILRPGDFALYSTNEPYEIYCKNRVDQLVVQLPYDVLLARLPQVNALTGCAVNGKSDIGQLVSTQLQQCMRVISRQSDVVQRHMQDMIMDLVVTGLATLENDRFELSRPNQMTLMRAKSTIRDHIKNATLDPNFVARAIGISPRHLARIFAQDGFTIAAFIRDTRMRLIAADLIDPRFATLSISEIAFKWGMNNLQHFSKLFKATHGFSPRAYRQRGQALQRMS